MIHETNVFKIIKIPGLYVEIKSIGYQSSDETETVVPVFQVHFSDREQQ